MMPVSEAEASELIKIEALRQITDNLKRLNDGHDKLADLVADVRERMIRMESSRAEHDIAAAFVRIEKLETKCDLLERHEDRRQGAIGLVEWVFKNWPGVLGFIAIIVLGVLVADGRVG